ncbi:MAG: uracil-DNA glycosylase [Verrucomicrobiaceae bacterium]|nr:uracil-DNA glycosylase [Verrucomicrobiaceae bacterium]
MGGSNAIATGLSALVDILRREKRRGGDTIALSAESERLLQAMPGAFLKAAPKAGRRAESRPAGAPETASTGRGAKAAIPPTAARSVAPTSAAGQKFPIPAVPEEERDEAWARAQLNAIFKAVKHCPECRGLGSLFETVVFAAGNPQAEIVFVGEAPGREEEKARRPFVGPAGKKLDQVLKAMGLPREQVYITNVVKYRPKKGDGRFQGAGNRPPQQDEMAASLPYLRAEIEVVRPRVIVALGRTAAEGLLEKGGSLARFRNAEHEFEGIPVIVTYHPSYLLRQESEADPSAALHAKRLVWEDMLRVMDRVGLPVTAKQRAYFL